VIYADTSFLVALYLPEEGSPRAIKWIERHKQAIPFTPLHRLELRTAIRLQVFRRVLSEEIMKEIFRDLDNDLDSEILAHTPIPWTDSFRNAELVGGKFAGTIGVRSFDLLHVGIAQALKFDQFLTFDSRQREAASAAGLRVDF
jgi:predicted nucleic acid-binding protein